jgi:predicted DNA-binding transcriptional regulator YafY
MRSEKAADLLRLALELSASAEGMTIEEMKAFSNVERRTIERRLAALEEVFGPLDRQGDGRRLRFRMNGRTIGTFATAPNSEELAELENAARTCEMARDPARATILRSLDRKIRASLRAAERNRLAPDIAARLETEALARQVGPRPFADARILTTLRDALLAEKIVSFSYGEDRGGASHRRRVIPYGLLFAPRYYLIGRQEDKSEPVLFRLSRISEIEITDDFGRPPADFDLGAYCARSFGVFQEEPQEIVLQFDRNVVDDARAYLFHPTQEMSDCEDGSLIVQFTAGGLLEVARHLLSWGATVSILAPQHLKNIMSDEVKALYDRHCAEAIQTQGSRRLKGNRRLI